MAAEEAGVGSVKLKKAPGSGMAAKKKKGKKKDGLGLLEEALVSDAEKKTKAAKKKERERKDRENRLRAEREKRDGEEATKKDPLLANTEAMIGSIPDDNDMAADGAVGRAANVANADAAMGTGVDQALKAMSMGAGKEDLHPEKRIKALHKAFEVKMMPQMKEDYPGLRQSQYKEKIFQLWKKSPENPMNQSRG